MNSLSKPTISIVMPVYNGEKFLKLAIESIINQTFKDFEFIIINDGSTDKTEEIIGSYIDSRIVYIKNEKNLGLSKSLNIGVRVAKGEYIARMDADDISIKDRLENQVNFLKHHQDIDITGSNVTFINEEGVETRKYSRPKTHEEIKWTSLFSSPLVHPTVMARSKVFKQNLYDENLKNSEDYELWSRLLFTTPIKFANLQKRLLYWRMFKTSFTQKLEDDKRAVSARNTISNIEYYIPLTENEVRILIQIRQEKQVALADLLIAWNTYKRAAHQFCQTEHLSPRKCLNIYTKLLSYLFFLIKHKIKHF